MATKPVDSMEWATDGGAEITEPAEAYKQQGWEAGQPAPSHYMNWWMNNAYDWQQYLEDTTDGAQAALKRVQLNLSNYPHGQGALKLNAFLTHGTYLFAAFDNGKVSRIPYNGYTWEMKNILSTTDEVSALASDGSIIVAVLTGGQIYTSSNNGDSWTVRTSAYSQTHNGAAYTGSKIVIVSDNDSIQNASSPFSTWTSRTSPIGATDDHFGVASDGAGIVVAVATSGQIIRSTDHGDTWTAVHTAAAALHHIVYDAIHGFIAMGSGGNFSYSTTGATWTDGTALGVDIRSIITNGSGLIVAMDTAGDIWMSGDGANFVFQPTSMPAFSGTIGNPAIFSSGSFVFGTSADTFVWVGDSFQSLRRDLDTTNSDLIALTVQVAVNRLTSFTSFTDTEVATLASVVNKKVAYAVNGGTNYLLAIGTGNDMVSTTVSADMSLTAAQSWSSNSAAVNYTGLEADNTFAVGVAAAGALYTSPGSTGYATWTSRTSGTANTLGYLSVGGGFWIAYGDSGSNTIRYNDTTDPTDAWSGSTSGLDGTTTYLGAAFGAGLHVAITSDNEIIYTADPSGAWTQATNPTTGTWHNMTFDGVRFWAVGGSGKIISSADGINWADVSVTGGGTIAGAFSFVVGSKTVYICAETNTRSVRYSTTLGTWSVLPFDTHLINSVTGIGWFSYVPSLKRVFIGDSSNDLVFSKAAN